MIDKVQIIVNKTVVERFEELAIDSNIYNVCSQFSFTVPAQYSAKIKIGDKVSITINDVRVLIGIIEQRGCSDSKDSQETIFSGRDLMGLVVDYHIESFKTLRNKNLQQVAVQYLSAIDHVKLCNITFINGADKLDIAQEYVQPHPGQTVFELLSGVAAARGIHFYMRADGNIVFGKPDGFGSSPHSIVCKTGRCDTVGYNFSEDISQQFSRITVIGQKQSHSLVEASQLNQKAVVVDDQYPALTKPFVMETQTAGVSLAKQARMIIEQQRFNGWRLTYTVAGFSSKGKVWQPDTLCEVDDKRIPFEGICLIYGRQFILNKQDIRTTLMLGKAGKP